MTVFILIGEVEYEGSDYLGVFATKELAEVKQREIENDKDSYYDHFVITEDTVIE